MKFTLTITDATPSEIANLMNSVAGLGAIIASNPPGTGTAPADDEDETAAPANIDPSAVDTKGLPWDERIHSKSKGVIGDGSWRKRKGVADDVVTAVEAELRARVQAAPPATAPVTAPPAAPPATAPAAPPATPPAPAPVTAPPVAPPAAPPATPPAPAPVPATTGAPADFTGFMEVVSKSMGANLIDSNGDFLKWLCSQPDVAVGQVTELAANPTKIAAAYAHLVAQNRIAP